MTILKLFPSSTADKHIDINTDQLIENTKCNVQVELIFQLDRYYSHYQQEKILLAPLRSQLLNDSNPLSRNSMPGHITASGIVVRQRKMLMIFHPFLKRWLQPGGHIDLNETPVQAARRELLEETGVHGKVHSWHEQHGMPLDINIHHIPENKKKREPEHLHYDFRYVFTSDSVIQDEGESDHQITWKNLQEINEINLQGIIEKLALENLLSQ